MAKNLRRLFVGSYVRTLDCSRCVTNFHSNVVFLKRNNSNVDTVRFKSTSAAFGVNRAVPTPQPIDQKEDAKCLDLTFSDSVSAFRYKTNLQLLRGWITLNLCSINVLVENNEKLMKLGRKILGQRLFEWLMKLTFYGHFVAGEDGKQILPVIHNLRKFGVKSILDYSAEDSLSEEEASKAEMKACTSAAHDGSTSGDSDTIIRYSPQVEFADRRQGVKSARTYFYLNEAQCERNLDIFLRCIDITADTTQGAGFAAIKVTALGRPQLLLQLSEVIARTRQYCRQVTGKKNVGNIIQDNSAPELFERKFDEANILEKPQVRDFLEQMTYDQQGLINLFSWGELIDSEVLLSELFRVPTLQTGRMESLISPLTREEEEMFKNMMRRLHAIFQFAKDRDVRVMVDAEQTYFQAAISRLTLEMMRKYNTEKAIVFNTYQCYLKDALKNAVVDLEQADRQDFYFGAKLVRGAYMEQERSRAVALGYDDPINPNFEATTEMYHRVLEEFMSRIQDWFARGQPTKVAVMVASHNENTVRHTVQKMKEHNIRPNDRVVCFGQLYGMCDQISFPLGESGYSVYKYLPYGPISEVLPYLSRRADENRGILAKVQKEKNLMKTELIRRLSNGQAWYTPTPRA